MSPELGTLTHVALALIGLYALFQFALVPLAWKAARPSATAPASPVSVARYAAVQFLRSATLMLALGALATIASLYATILYVDRLGEDSLEAVQNGLLVVRSWRDVLATIDPQWAAILLGAIVLAFVVLTYKSS